MGKVARRAALALAIATSGAGCDATQTPQDEVALTTHALTTQLADVAFALAPPSIDGFVHPDDVWSRATAYPVNFTIAGEVWSAADLSATWKSVWDADALYLLVTVSDESLQNDSAAPWDDDSIEIYLDGDDSKASTYTADDYQLVIGWNDVNVVEAHGKSVPNVVFAKQNTANGYQMEVRIPWTSINSQPAISWRTIGIDVHVNDDDHGGGRDGKRAWNTDFDSSWTDPRTFGDARLLPEGLPTCPAETSDIAFQIDRLRVAPVIDGREDTSGAYGWSSIGYLSPAPISGVVSSTSDLSGEWKLIWDTSYLYFLATVVDDVKRNDSQNPWDDDSVELYIDGDNSKATSYTRDDYQFVFGWNDGTVVEAHGKSTAGISFAKRDTATGYQIEARIPWSAINSSPAVADRVIGIDVHVNDDDDGGGRDGKMSWASRTDQSWTNPSTFGTAETRGACTTE